VVALTRNRAKLPVIRRWRWRIVMAQPAAQVGGDVCSQSTSKWAAKQESRQRLTESDVDT